MTLMLSVKKGLLRHSDHHRKTTTWIEHFLFKWRKLIWNNKTAQNNNLCCSPVPVFNHHLYFFSHFPHFRHPFYFLTHQNKSYVTEDNEMTKTTCSVNHLVKSRLHGAPNRKRQCFCLFACVKPPCLLTCNILVIDCNSFTNHRMTFWEP